MLTYHRGVRRVNVRAHPCWATQEVGLCTPRPGCQQSRGDETIEQMGKYLSGQTNQYVPGKINNLKIQSEKFRKKLLFF